MADTVFMLRRKFGGCFSKFWKQKNGVIPKTIRTTRSISNHPFNHPFHATTIARWFSQRDNATETGSALLLWQTLKLLQNRTEALFIGRIRAHEASRVNSRGTTEGINL